MLTEESRSVLETLARSFTDRDDLVIEYGNTPCTDFRKIFIRNDATIFPGVDCTPGELWLSQKANTAHESAHLLFTSEKAWKSFCRGLIKKHILNIVEDARVEKAMANFFPGTLRWFRFSNEYAFIKNSAWKYFPQQDLALYELCLYAVVGRVHDEIPENEKRFVQECAPHIDKGRASATTEGAAEEAAKIVEIYKTYYGLLPTLPEPKIAFGAEPKSSPEGKLDPRRKPKLEPIKDQPEEPEQPEVNPDSDTTGGAEEEDREAETTDETNAAEPTKETETAEDDTDETKATDEIDETNDTESEETRPVDETDEANNAESDETDDDLVDDTADETGEETDETNDPESDETDDDLIDDDASSNEFTGEGDPLSDNQDSEFTSDTTEENSEDDELLSDTEDLLEKSELVLCI
jgi:hypothetical protein